VRRIADDLYVDAARSGVGARDHGGMAWQIFTLALPRTRTRTRTLSNPNLQPEPVRPELKKVEILYLNLLSPFLSLRREELAQRAMVLDEVGMGAEPRGVAPLQRCGFAGAELGVMLQHKFNIFGAGQYCLLRPRPFFQIADGVAQGAEHDFPNS